MHGFSTSRCAINFCVDGARRKSIREPGFRIRFGIRAKNFVPPPSPPLAPWPLYRRTGRVSFRGAEIFCPKYSFRCLHENQVVVLESLPDLFARKWLYENFLGGCSPLSPWAVDLCPPPNETVPYATITSGTRSYLLFPPSGGGRGDNFPLWFCSYFLCRTPPPPPQQTPWRRTCLLIMSLDKLIIPFKGP